MATLDDYKNEWLKKPHTEENYQTEKLELMIKQRVKKQTGSAMRYFWASLTYHIIVYAMLVHVIVRYHHLTTLVLVSIGGIIVFVPFTIILLRKFKAIARLGYPSAGSPISEYLNQQLKNLTGFFTFKKRYELILIPVSSAIGVYLTFAIYVPGGITQNFHGALIVFVVTVLSCVAAIRNENKKNFREPIRSLQNIVDELRY
jgi:hypothetical protein